MANTPPTRAQRDANLDALEKAVNEWAESEKTRLENEVKFMRAVLQGRGVSEAGSANLALGALEVAGEINDFLVGA